MAGGKRSSRSLTRSGLVAVLAALSCGNAAHAADWSATAGLSQRISADSNVTAATGGNNFTFGSSTGLNLNLRATTKTTTFGASTGVAVRQFVGPGATGNLSSSDPRLNLNFSHQQKRTTYDGSLSFSAAQTTFTEIDGTGPRDEDARRFSIGGNLGVTRSIDSRNVVGAGVNASVIEFTENSDDFQPSRSVGFSTNWDRALSENTTGGLSFSVDRFAADTPEDPVSWTFSPAVTAAHQVNHRLGFAGSAGISLTQTERTLPGSGQRVNETDVGGTGGVTVDFVNGPTSVTVDFSQSLDANAAGELINVTALDMTYDRVLTPRHDVAFSTSVARRDVINGFAGSGGQDSIVFSFGPSLNYQVSRNWSASVGYNFTLVNDAGGTGVNNGVFLSLGRTFDLLR